MQTEVLGDYQIIKQIGQGSLGSVYLAEHRFMKRHFVLKLFPEELSNDRSFIQRFEEEITALSTLDHPNIAKVLNVSFAEGRYFLVTECIVDEAGETTNLTKYLLSREKKFDEDELLRLLTQVAEALDFAHTKKPGGRAIIHRCLKPNNILVAKGEKGVDLKVCDFGLSRIVGLGNVLTRTFKMVAEALSIADQEGYSPLNTKTSNLSALHQSFLQNYLFVSPEQKIHDMEVTAKADIYAFGVLAYYMITYEYPEGIFDLPSERNFGKKYNWDHLIRSSLRKDPKKRPASLKALMQEIQQKERTPATAKHAMAEAMQVKQPAAETVPSGASLTPIIHTSKIERPEVDHDPASVFHVDSNVKHYVPEQRKPANVEPIQTDLVVIPGGTSYRGSNDGNRDEMPRHQITINSFAIDVHPVTNEQFVRFLEVMGGEKDHNHNDIIRLKESRIKRSGGKVSIESGYLKHPVVGVTWYGALAYANWVGKRLPTEVEWEIAAKGGEENALYPTGDDIEKTQANFFSSDTIAVQSYPANGYGLYDMAGNVYEWCQDWYGYNYYETSIQEPINPKGPIQGVYRVLRGGCWKSLKEDLRCSRRHRNNPGTMNSTYGFRCAADVK